MFGREALTPADLRFGYTTDDVFADEFPDPRLVGEDLTIAATLTSRDALADEETQLPKMAKFNLRERYPIYVDEKMRIHHDGELILSPAPFDLTFGEPLIADGPARFIRIFDLQPNRFEEQEGYVENVTANNDSLVLTNTRAALEDYTKEAIDDDEDRLEAKDYVLQLAARLAYAKAVLLREEIKRKKRVQNHKRRDTHKFEIGDLIWLSVPLRTEKRGRGGANAPIKKFQFRWAGPMRVVSKSMDSNRYTVVELLPGGQLLSQISNAARLRPFEPLPPPDNPTAASANIASDDFAAEIAAWKELRVIQRRPKIKVAPGINKELLRRFDDELADADYNDPEFYIEKLDYHSYDRHTHTYK
ncbi:hypothetical protein HDU67_002587 [Dinochytrium kinnereticum]|nr:hypothetical protein HDU67_002587 [Dinochytrium kinnereticum]